MEKIVVGRVLRPHGVRGQVKVEPLTHDPKRFKDLSFVYCRVKDSKDYEKLIIRGQKLGDKWIYLKFQGFDNKDDVERFRDCYLEIPLESRLELPQDHYYIFELEGLTVYSVEGRKIGILKEVLSLPANDVYRIVDGSQEYLIPATKEVVKKIDLQGKTMTILALAGLLGDE